MLPARSLAVVLTLPALAAAQDDTPLDVGAHFETTVVESRFGTTAKLPWGLQGDIYYLKTGAVALPKFEKLKPVGTIFTNGLNLPPRDFADGFPGVTDRLEWFAIDYTGRFYVTRPGKYRFTLISDDGSKLYIDGRSIINNDGVHGPLRMDGWARLTEGMHTIRISYFQGPRYAIALMLGVMRPGDKKWSIFNTDEFKPPVP